ncbi:hypothetical protein [Microcystis phage Mae-Yong1326-1]|nr:hypothetical protein [Microcystis phage Mae-Yong1326-1]
MRLSPGAFLARVLDPGLDWVEANAGVSRSRAAARPFLLAVAMQETGLAWRAQIVAGDRTRAGPARGWWQFEQPTLGLLLGHRVSQAPLRALCRAAVVPAEPDDIWRVIEGHDSLAVGVARLLLLTDPQPIPVAEDDAWACYADRLWRPGAWSRGTPVERQALRSKWAENWRAAQQAVGGR